MPNKRVGLIGFGLGGATFHAPLVSHTPGLTLAAIVTRDPDRRAAAAGEYPHARLCVDVTDMLSNTPDLDLVVVSSPSGKHVEHAMAAIDAGLAVVVDKPFATTVADAERLIDAAAKRGVMIAPFHNRRWDGDFLTLQRLLVEGRLGEVIRFESRFERWRVVPKPRWLASNAIAAAEGMLYDLHSHLIDQALVLFGPVTSVYAEADQRRAGGHADDDSFVALTHASGVRSHLKATIVAAHVAPRYRVYGTRAAYVKLGVDPQEEMLKAGARPGDAGFGDEKTEAWGTVSDGETSTSVPTETGAYSRYYAAVAAALDGHGSAPVDARDAVTGLRIIEAARRSSETGTVVRMD
jgi:scyllo-inositol 2-dehydrogenase (NADP+)